MNILSAQSLAKSHGLKLLFSDLSFGIDERDRIGIIGPNGTGKSTLMKILARIEPRDSGLVVTRQDLRVEYLPQKPEFETNHTVIEHVFSSSTPMAALVRDYESISHQLEGDSSNAELLRKFDDLSHRMDMEAAWEYESRAKSILGKLGIQDFDAQVATLSGGYRKRVALARALLTDSDLLLLDEPTNHLDVDTIDWLEDYLERYPGAVILVTHDRYFLDRVTQRIFELDRGKLRIFDGNFSYYLERKAELEATFAVMEERRRNILRREIEWLKRGAKARTTKQKARVKRAEGLGSVSHAQERDELSFDVQTRRLGKKIIELEAVSKSLGGRKLIEKFSYVFTRGERMGIIGPNGSGKTTLVNLLTGVLAPDEGSISTGETVVFSTYDQESKDLDPGERAIDYVKREGGEMLRAPDGSFMTAAVIMERFLFTPQMLYAPIGKLSGGEQRRLYLVRTLMRDPNFLILDEPTNDLDIPTLQALEDFLDGFGGCLIVISHDRYFLDRTITHILSFEGNGVLRTYPGDYTTYVQIREDLEVRRRAAEADERRKNETRTQESKSGQVETTKNPPLRKLSYKEQQELQTLEFEIPQIENRLKQLPDEMAVAASDFTRLQALSTEHDMLQARLENAIVRWEELASRV